MPKSMIFGTGYAVVQRDENIRGLQVAMNEALLVRVLDGGTELNEQAHAFFGAEQVLIAMPRDRAASDQFHDEKRPAGFRGAGVENVRDVWVIHQRKGLALRFEARDYLTRVHPELDDLECHPPAHRFLLLGHEDDTTAAFTQTLQQAVATDPHPRTILARNTAFVPTGVASRPGQRR